MSDINEKLTPSEKDQEDKGAKHPSKGRKRRSKRSKAYDDELIMRKLYPYTVFEYCCQMASQDGDKDGQRS